MKIKHKNIKVPKESQGIRLDQFLKLNTEIPSRSKASSLIKEKKVLVNQKKSLASYLLKENDLIEFFLEEKKESIKAYNKEIDLVYEDDHILIINKKEGVVTHPSETYKKDTLIHHLLFHQKKLFSAEDPLRPGVVHRLDKDTHGLIVFAKSKEAFLHLKKQFLDKTIKRTYWALVKGVITPPYGTIETYLKRHPKNRKKFSSCKKKVPEGKKAITSFRLLKTHKNISWIECELQTGRTHQIRVHLSEKAHPVLSDPIYGRKMKEGPSIMALCAYKIALIHPVSNKRIEFKIDWSPHIKDFLKKIDFEQNVQ